MLNQKMGWRSGLLGILLITLLLSTFPLLALAEGGDGTGSANGVMKPLGLVSVTLEDGTKVSEAANIPLKPKFMLHFNKNVVYLIYWEKNTKCFNLYDESNKEVKINLTKIDDTVDFSKRQYIWVEPVEALSPGTHYKLYVAPDLLAKNGGSTLGMTTNNQGVTINFTTTGTKAAPAPVVASPPVVADPTSTQETNPPVVAPDPPPIQTSAAQIPAPAANAASTTPVVALPTDSSSSVPATALTPGAAASAEKANVGDTPSVNQEANKANGSNQNKEGLPTGSANPTKADAVQFAANEQSRRMQNYLAAVAVIILLLWVGAEVMKRKRKRIGR